MIVSGYRRPLVQEDLWDLKEEDETDKICQGFQETMKWELMKARSRLKNRQQKASQKLRTEPCHNGLAKGVSQDVLVMVRADCLWLRPDHITVHVYQTNMTCKESKE